MPPPAAVGMPLHLESVSSVSASGRASTQPCGWWIHVLLQSTEVHRKTNLILGVFLIRPVPQSRAGPEKGTYAKVRGRFTPVPKVSTGAAKDFRRV
jgi:hypothetical protein